MLFHVSPTTSRRHLTQKSDTQKSDNSELFDSSFIVPYFPLDPDLSLLTLECLYGAEVRFNLVSD